MEHTKNHNHHKNNTKTDTNTKDRKREMKMQAKEMECMTGTTNITSTKERGGDKESTEDDEEEEEDTSANTAKTTTNFKRVKTTETEDDTGFSTTSASNRECHDATSECAHSFDGIIPEGTMLHHNTSPISEFITVGERLAALYNGTLMSRETQNGRGGSKGLRFKCANSHEFTISYEKLSRVPEVLIEREQCKDIWCVKCHNFYYRCSKKAADNGAVVTSKIFDQGYVKMSCRMNHNFKVSIHRNPDKVWCPHCKKDAKNEYKRQMEIENEIRRKKEIENQQKLFEESKKRLENEKAQQEENHQKYTINEILIQVDMKSKIETQKFMSLGQTNLSEESVYQVYKIIYMPSEILQASFLSLREGLNSCFRKMAILVHPDKNSHPLANRAFQKLSEVYNVCQQIR